MVASDPRIALRTKVLPEVRVDAEVFVGGLGGLYTGRASASRAPVFVRVMRADAVQHARDAFAREVLVVRHVEHDGVVLPLHAGIEGNLAVIAYEPVNGSLLASLVRGPRMPLSSVARITRELAAILNHAHRQPAPLLHGSLSCTSVMLAGDNGAVRLLDLGVVQALERSKVFDDARWELLDPAAASPELVTRTFPISPATDVFGLASIVYECLTGSPPFPATNAAEANATIAKGARPRASEVRRELPAELDRLLGEAWSVDPRSRPHDIVAFADALGVVLEAVRGASSLPRQRSEPAEDFGSEGQMTVRGQIPDGAIRAQTLPFGIRAAVPSEPPADIPTPRRVPVVESVEVDFSSDRPPAPAPVPDLRPAAAAPPMAIDPDVRTVRVVNVTAIVVAMLIAGAIVVVGAVHAGIGALARVPPTPAPAPPAPAPAPSPAPVAAAPSPAPAPSPLPLASTIEPAPPPPPTTTLASTAPDMGWPELPKESGPRPSPKAIDVMHKKLVAAFAPCIEIPPRPPAGIPWMVHFEFDGPTGRPALVEVSRPFKGTLGGACMLRASLDARVPPFDSGRWAIDLKFGP